ncbi:MAG: nitroreductase family protein [Anaerolineae bacterium]|jgi:nitroreductase
MADLMDLLFERRSIRSYTDEPVRDEQVEAMLKAAMAAPSARGLQPCHYLVLRDRKQLDDLSEVHKHAYMLKKAPLAIVVCGDQTVSKKHWVEDTCAATQNLLLAATALGLGGVWITLYPKKKHQKYAHEVLDIPDDIGILCAVALGHPAEKKKLRTQYDTKRVHHDKW